MPQQKMHCANGIGRLAAAGVNCQPHVTMQQTKAERKQERDCDAKNNKRI